MTAGYYMRGAAMSPYAPKLEQLLQKANIAANVTEQGVSGERVVPHMVDRLPRELANKKGQGIPYDWVLILGGVNDLGNEEGPHTIADGLYKLYSICKEYGAQVLAMTIMESSVATDSFEKRRNMVNQMIMAAPTKEGFGHVHVHDLAKGMPYHTLPVHQRAAIWDDGLHLTPLGYEGVANSIFQTLKPLLQRP